jgi:hypothetical protein
MCVTVFTENRIEAFVPQVKNFAELKLGEMLGGGSRVSIGSIEGGILHPIILNNIRIVGSEGAALASPVDIDSIKTDYRIWDVFSRIRRESAERNKVSGVLNTSFFGKVLFSGSIRGDSFDMAFESQKGIVRASGVFSDDGGLSVELAAEHLKIGDFDIVCNARSSISALRGEFQTQNLVVNYRPAPDIKIFYSVAGDTLNIDDAGMGDMFRLTGKVLLKYPNNMEMVLTSNNVSLGWLFTALGVKGASEILTGTMNGRFELKGPGNRLKMAARMNIRKGTMAELDFDALSATLKGDLPYLRIEDARITRQSGYFTLEGEMDVRKIGKNSFFDNIKLSSADNAINWDGWKSAKTQDVQEIRMNKRLSDDINVDFKKFVADEKVDESIKDKDEVGFEYKLHPNDSLKMVVGKDREFLGLEHKDKF